MVIVDPTIGSYKYRPDPDYNGEDTFSFIVIDDDDESSEPALVSVTINPVNDAPELNHLRLMPHVSP